MNYQGAKRLKKETVTIDPDKVNKMGLIVSVIVIFCSIFFYKLIWGASFTGILKGVVEWVDLKGIIVLLLLIITHEMIHGIGYVVIGKSSFKDVKFGVIWKQLMPYAHCKKAMKISAYRWSITLPTIFLGACPFIIGLFTNNPHLYGWGTYMILGGIGDIMILRVLHSYNKDVYIIDHPEEVGCNVYIPQY